MTISIPHSDIGARRGELLIELKKCLEEYPHIIESVNSYERFIHVRFQPSSVPNKEKRKKIAEYLKSNYFDIVYLVEFKLLTTLCSRPSLEIKFR